VLCHEIPVTAQKVQINMQAAIYVLALQGKCLAAANVQKGLKLMNPAFDQHWWIAVPV